jgi:hypothetical protein
MEKGGNMSRDKMIAKTATEGLKLLWSEKFFEKYRKVSDIVNTFSKRHHHFTDAELGMALKRAKYLTRKGKRGSYEYIQKYPFVEVEKNVNRKKPK